MHVQAAAFLVAAGALLYGWRALATVGAVVLSTWAGAQVWRHIGWRGRQLNVPRCLWMALLLSLMLPPHWLAQPADAGLPHLATWPLIPASGLLLAALAWVLGPLGSGRVHPVLATYLVLVILFEPLLMCHWVLRLDHVFFGDLFNAQNVDTSLPRTQPWVFGHQFTDTRTDALYVPESAAGRLTLYTSGTERPERFSVSLQMVLRDRMPPLEDLILGGEPGPIGLSSAVAVIMGGLFLLYRGLIDYRIPLLAVATAICAFLIFPVPVIITDTAEWRWVALRAPYLGWPAAVTLANYELMASPLMFVVFFLATSPQSRPMNRRARAAYAILLGLLAALAQMYGSVSFGPYVALLLASLMSPVLDRWLQHRTLV